MEIKSILLNITIELRIFVQAFSEKRNKVDQGLFISLILLFSVLEYSKVDHTTALQS